MEIDRLILEANEFAERVQLQCVKKEITDAELKNALANLMSMQAVLANAIEEKKEQIQSLMESRKAKIAYHQGGVR